MIYWDYNASAPLRPEVAELLSRAFREGAQGNASSVHRAGRDARTRLDAARAKVARRLGCEPKEICFTGSGSEGAALALKGGFASRKDASRTRVVTSSIEHPAVRSAVAQLKAQGAKVTEVPPQADGRVRAEDLLEALGPDVALCSLMWANNETGVLQPAAEIARACRKRGILFHTDAVQAVGKVPVSLREVDADLLSLSAHKFGGPAGVGALVIRRGVEVQALVPGHQEWGRRAGTQSLPLIEGLALALELSADAVEPNASHLSALRDRFEQRVREEIPGVKVNGEGAPRVPNTSNLHFTGADGEALLIALDLDGICASSGAACASGSLSPSHVLLAMGLSSSEAFGSVRFSLGPGTTTDEVEQVVQALRRHVPQAREAARSSAMG